MNETLREQIYSYVGNLCSWLGFPKPPRKPSEIAQRLGIKVIRYPLPRPHRGMLLPERKILINAEEIEEAQEITIAHELMHFVLEGLSPGEVRTRSSYKEEVCELGAFEVLLPLWHFREKVREYGFSISSLMPLKSFYGSSLSATLFRMIDAEVQNSTAIIWELSHKPSDILRSKKGQLSLWGKPSDFEPRPRLRVKGIRLPPKEETLFVPLYKAVSKETSIYKALYTRNITKGFDELSHLNLNGIHWTESLPHPFKNTWRVLSLIRL